MILYRGNAWGFGLLFRLHGSAAARAVVPASMSLAIYFAFYYSLELDLTMNMEWKVVAHPYPIAALVAAFTFLITFRANFSYNRYWEAAGSVHQMQSKWLDCGMTLAAFHMQAERYDSLKPPSFGKHPELKSIVRERERLHERDTCELVERMEDEDPSLRNRIRKFLGMQPKKTKKPKRRQMVNINRSASGQMSRMRSKIPIPDSSRPSSSLQRIRSEVHRSGIFVIESPSLFLQELCHLLSLLNAVAMSTLRNDIEYAESPLVEYIPGDTWPPVDPDELQRDVRKLYGAKHATINFIQYMVGVSRNVKHRTLYNAARPFGVLGGVSDGECELLQSARGPCAKVALCTMWLQEFISREYLNGSTGNVAPPILSRLFQEVSDGMVGYNQARKVAYIPFPFPHAQISSLFILVLVVVLPWLNLSYSNYLWTGAVLNFFTIMCFAGLHEVARELECPFQNTPNDLPLTTFQAQFNEALITMYAGYNPDAYWTVSTSIDKKESGSSPNQKLDGL